LQARHTGAAEDEDLGAGLPGPLRRGHECLLRSLDVAEVEDAEAGADDRGAVLGHSGGVQAVLDLTA
jgi:hypothetical protein